MIVKYPCKFYGIPCLFHPKTVTLTPITLCNFIFDLALIFHEGIIFLCSIFIHYYEPNFPIDFKESKSTKRLFRQHGIF